ncbi:hypothetical protein H072_4487 [Dactylellina haptotyla CBS 200.50]|uniref:Uncharacterized protein n=1 Tax=Dactylellina haptotyla (strain CBS 200.50) TaxID=1284197 RepID=S8BQ78_DACHA|nr:hypothetical protein H072_4487 [Dactylellina haptotyla CBS 200.50]
MSTSSIPAGTTAASISPTGTPPYPAMASSVVSNTSSSSGNMATSTAPSVLLKFLDSSMYYPIYESIVMNLGFDDIARLSFTCKALSSLPRQIINRECNVDRMLRHWFACPRKARSVMAEQNAVIGSHFATALFSREYSTSGLRFYVTLGSQAAALEDYIRSEGYQEVPKLEPKAESRRKKFAKPSSPYFVEMRLCSNSPIGAFLAAVNTTHLLNLVTSHRAYSMFPISSFLHKVSFITRDLNTDSVQHTLARYSHYDYDFQPILWSSSSKPYTREITSPRRFGDKLSWVVEFDNTNIPDPVVPKYVVESTCFRLSVTPDPNIFVGRQQNFATSRYRLSCSAFKSCVLKHTYTFGCSAWRNYIGARVDALSRIELFKLPTKDRANLDMNIKKDFYTFEGQFQKHVRWKYCDHLVREWWDDWVTETTKS